MPVLSKISDLIKNKLQKYVPDEKRMQSALAFGINMALYTIVSTAGLLLISLAMGSFIQGVIIIAICYLNQTIGGGYHANTHMKCFLSMSFFLIVGILFCKLNVPNIAMCCMGMLSGIILLVYPVVLHPNRAFLKYRLPHFTKRSRYLTCLELLLVVFLGSLRFRHFDAYVIAMILSAVSRTAAKHSKHFRTDRSERANQE